MAAIAAVADTESEPRNMATLWRVEEAAEYLGIRPKTLYEWVRSGRVPYRKIGFNVRFDPEELERWTQSQARGARPGGSSPGSPDGAADAAVGTLVELAGAASAALRDLERDVGTSLSYPQRRKILELAERLDEATSALDSG